MSGLCCLGRCVRPMVALVVFTLQALALAAPAGAAAGGVPGDPSQPSAWPSLEEQLQADHVAPESALARLISENQELGLLRPAEAGDGLGLPPWLRVLWHKHHPSGPYPPGDPTGGYPRLLRDLHRWMVGHQDLQAGKEPAAETAAPVARSASESGEVRISGAQTLPRGGATIRVNRWNPQQIIAASQNPYNGATVQYYSADGGATWGPGNGGSYYQFNVDPAVDWTSDGTDQHPQFQPRPGARQQRHAVAGRQRHRHHPGLRRHHRHRRPGPRCERLLPVAAAGV
jgi:hypothetical protein